MSAFSRRIAKFMDKHVVNRDIHKARKAWRRDDGDRNLRLDYPLDSDSVVFDLGGYQGDFADAIHTRYGCTVFVFEPVDRFFQHCEARFAGNPSIRCFRFGLGAAEGSFEISDSADASSLYAGSTQGGERIRIVDADVFLREHAIERIDLMKVNIEGGEFELLPRLIEAGHIARIRELQVQFHDFIPDSRARRAAIRSSLARTHAERWCYPFVWESWRKS
jgi:FkbM family methyltransferase